MKHLRLFVSALLLAGGVTAASAYDFESGGIYYNVTGGNTVEVTNNNGDSSCYSGSLEIPASVSNGDTDYAVTAIGTDAFSGNTALESVVIPEGVCSIGEGAFRNCNILASVNLPSTLTTIGSSAFMNCLSLNTAVVIPKGVTTIPSYCFNNCGILESVDIPDGVTEIGSCAFLDCSKLSVISLPSTLTSLEYAAFGNCSSLTSVEIPSGVTTIPANCYIGCSSLTSVMIHEGVKIISGVAFASCYNLKTIELPSTLKTIAQGAFRGSSLSTVIVNAVTPPSCGDNALGGNSSTTVKVPASGLSAYREAYIWKDFTNYYCDEVTIDGITYRCDDKTATIYSVDPTLTEATILPTVDVDGRQCAVTFGSAAVFSNLTKLIISEGVTTLGNSAFSGCSKLESLTLPSTLTTIPNSAFQNCSSLTSLAIPEGVTTLGNSAFSGCSKLESLTLPSTLTTISNSAFQNCSSLTSLAIPEGVTTLGNGAFSGCSKLETLTLPSTLTTIPPSAFQNCNSLTSLAIPEGVTTLGNSAFYGCSKLETLTLPSKLTTIGDNAFKGCSGLTSLAIPEGVTTLGNSAFYGCSKLESLTLPSALTTIPNSAFQNCSNLTSLAIPEGVTTLGNSAFYGCSKLESLTLPSALTTIPNSAFQNCSNLKSLVIPEEVVNIGANAFSGCSNLTLTLPSTLKEIGNGAFRDCSSLKEVDLPEGLTTIGVNAFNGCNGLKFLTIPSIVTSIGQQAFDGISFPMIKVDATTPPALRSSLPMETVIVPFASVKAYKAADYWKDMNIIGGGKNDIEVTTSETVDLTEAIMLQAKVTPASVTTIKVHGPLSSDDVLTTLNTNMRSCYSVDLSDATIDALPDGAFSGKAVLLDIVLPPNLKRIGSNAFKDCIALLSKITITEGVESIGDYAFSGCKNATFSTQLPESLTSIGEFAFQGCNFAEMTLPDGLKTIGRCAFYQCANLTQVMLPDGLTSLGSSAFQGCTALTTADMMNPMELNYVPASAFDGCTNLRNVYLPFNISFIGYRAFYNCTSLERIDFVAPVKRIAGSAFEGCTSLKSLDLFKCEQFTEIGDAAFRGCTSLKSLNLPASLQTIGSSAFSGCTSMNAISSPALVPPTIADDSTLSGIDMDECILTMPKDKYLDYFRAPYWGQFVEYTASVLVGVEGQGSVMYANNGVAQQSALKAAAMRAPSANADVTAIAYDNANICAKDNSTLTFKIEPAEGYELKSVTYAGEDVTAQVVDGLFTTPIINGDTNINVTFAVSTDYLAMSSAAVSKGAEVEVPVELVNSTAVVGLECNVQIPEGFKVAKNSDGSLKVAQTSRKADQTLTATIDGQVLSIKTIGSQAYTGTEGAVLTIAITPDDAATPADYVLKITDVKFVSADGTATRPDAKTTLTLRDYVLGDVDSDQMVAINDAVIVMNHIVGADTPAFNAKAADMDGNGSVEINDAVMILNNIVGEASTKSLKTAARTDGLTADELTAASVEMEQGGTAVLSLDLTNLDCLTAAQFEIELPEGITAGKASAAERASSHMVKTHMDGNTLKVAMLSMDLADFEGNEGAILTLPLTADREMMAGTYALSLRNVKMSDARGTLYTLPDTDSSIIVKNWGGINDACADALRATGGNGVIVVESPREMAVQIVAVDGRTQAVEVAPGKTTVAVSAGVYVVAGQKIIVK